MRRFNPRARAGRDFRLVQTTEYLAVSIHAPAWGATRPYFASCSLMNRFQSTRPRGARHVFSHEILGLEKFQSTRPRGARPRRSRTAGEGIAVSIHAPAWGATDVVALVSQRVDVSIHAPAWGATYYRIQLNAHIPVSIHAPAWGATFLGQIELVFPVVSIHAPAWGATKQK